MYALYVANSPTAPFCDVYFYANAHLAYEAREEMYRKDPRNLYFSIQKVNTAYRMVTDCELNGQRVEFKQGA